MGSLKDEMRGLRENHQLCEKADDGEGPGGSDGSTVPERPEINRSRESATEDDSQPKVLVNVSYVAAGETRPDSKDQALSGGDSDADFIQGCVQVNATCLTWQAEADGTTIALQNDVTIAEELLSDQYGEKVVENIVVPVPVTPDPFNPRSPDLRSPAPYGQHHVRTQVSLEVVQCHSAATSPMTPPEGGSSFFFPSSFGRSEGVGTDSKDAELQVGRQVEFCSVATSPMTPKTPSTSAFPELTGREVLQKVKNGEKQKESSAVKTPAESEKSGSVLCPDNELIDLQVTVEESNQPCTQQRMGSMDQDITILVTQYGNNEEGEDDKAESSFYSIEPEMVKIDEYEEVKQEEGKETAQQPGQKNANPPQNKTEESSFLASEQSVTIITSDNSKVKDNTDVCVEFKDVTKPHVPESPAPFGCHNIRTQVSLEVVQCQSVATSPMTPPEGDQAFYFPSSFGKHGTVSTETKDAELQVGQQAEFRSVATAPMTPRTPIATSFPEIRKEVSVEEKIVEEEEEEGKKEHAEEKEEVSQKEGKLDDKSKEEAAQQEKGEETVASKEEGEDKCEEPVQEVSWDEKGMTWEVYGAVVEVSVLGSAIQKHLEKQVKKQKRQPSMPPPPPLQPSATPLAPESTQGAAGSGKGQAGKRGERDGKVRRHRRNPFRMLMENVQQPHCCSRAHTTE